VACVPRNLGFSPPDYDASGILKRNIAQATYLPEGSDFHHLCRRVRRITKSEHNFVMSLCPSVHQSTWNNLAATGRIFMVFDTFAFFRKSSTTIKVWLKPDKNIGHFTWRPFYRFIVAGDINAVQHSLLTVTCSSASHTERIVDFPLQQWITRRLHSGTLYVLE
jgi:hypothetical protein